ncbi:alpha/beta fold hydrolase [Aporhodopirellula aestuarii]|uniref:Alpha/beta hydrolase n=1 Tax=Aporhodopirellula aestuarii TaxID=2950107 RepID=A0ABT0U0W8_9BACT|nr:alpha/beta hydrolase [Aporhodopirellula aestuarii]MCM2370490.1 alpha/beta hydrolase [Aporhodopirellula aestuarii]
MTDENTLPLIFFPGLAADANIFVPQAIAFPQLIVPPWPSPETNESLDSYAQRVAEDLRDYGPCIVGGASFGGIVSLHVAKYLDARAVLLIGSIASPDELPTYGRIARPLKRLVRLLPIRMMQWLATPLASNAVRRIAPFSWGLVRQFRGSDPDVFRWSLARILDWHDTPVLDCPVFHVHGDRDRTLPIRYTQPDTVVRGGGHVISLTHADEVNAFIRDAINQINHS